MTEPIKIALNASTLTILDDIRQEDESYDEVILRLISENNELELEYYKDLARVEEYSFHPCHKTGENLDYCKDILEEYYDEDLEDYVEVSNLFVVVLGEWVELKEKV